jgi:hypothetical protein
MNTSQPNQTQASTPNIPEEKTKLLNIRAPRFAAATLAEKN